MDDNVQSQTAPPQPDAATVAATPAPSPPKYDAILSIPVTVQVVLGATTMPVAGLMKLWRGAVISLDQKVGDPEPAPDTVVAPRFGRVDRRLFDGEGRIHR